MALKFFHDANATEPIDEQNPDIVHEPVDAGGTLLNEKKLYLASTNALLAYENLTIRGEVIDVIPEEASGIIVSVMYALDNNGSPGTYEEELELPDGDYQTPLPVWRRVYVQNVDQAFKATIEHIVPHVEYIAWNGD